MLVPVPSARTAAVAVHLHVGSRYESARDNGICHFLEHMLHRGTVAHPSAHAQALAFERLGATLAAATYADHGVLSVGVPPANVEGVLELLGEVCRAPIFDAIDVERGIVREEILESLDAHGRRTEPDDLLREVAFPRHPLGFPITGGLDTLARFDRDALRRCHRRYYTSDLVVTVAGRFSPRAVRTSVARHFRMPNGHAPRARAPRPLPGPALRHVRDASSQTALRLGFRAPGIKHAAEPATELLLRVIDDGTSTRLYHRLCDERGLCYDVSALYEAHADVGLLELAADCSHEHTLEVAEELVALCRELRDEGPREDELDKARARLGFQLDAMRDSPGELAAFHGFAELFGLARTPEARLAEFESVTTRAVRAAAARLFRADRLALLTVGSLTASETKRLRRAVASLA
ncbi:MAG TPA: pitrilysin family protein [Polyangiaceae bacterium]|nr:pitrilysin family protein [Polyangiaceae bacterium]